MTRFDTALSLAVLVALSLTVVRPRTARADDTDIATVRMGFAERRGSLTVTTGFTDIFDREGYEKLSSGFPTTLVVRIYIYRTGVELPVSYVVTTHQVVYDLWGERFTVRSTTPTERVTKSFRNRAEVIKEITSLHRFPIAKLSQIDIGPHYFAGVAVELNPVSQELLAEMRRWLSKPAGNSQLDTSSTFFGSFVSVFVNPKLREADNVLRIRSQPFYRVPR